jgi:hypothetical protein
VTVISKCKITPSVAIATTTPNDTIEQVRIISGRNGTCLKLKRVYDGI